MTETTEPFFLSSLDDVYGVMRKVQGEHTNHPATKKTKCIGAGNCCKVGLVIPVLECRNIAKQIRRQYWVKYEGEGKEEAERWYKKLIFRLQDAFNDLDWSISDETATTRQCAFFTRAGGCSIYEFRPFVCRAYGTIAPVDTACPRPRDENGNVVIFLSNEIDNIIRRFDRIVEAYGEAHPEANYSVFMPLGVLKFLLTEEEMKVFINSVDKKFSQARPGYAHSLWKVREND